MITGDDVREARIALGMTQKALAEALQVSTRTVNAWENGREIFRGHYSRLADVLALSPERAGARAGRELDASDLQLIAELTRNLGAAMRNVAQLAERLADLNDAALAAREGSQIDNENVRIVTDVAIDEASLPRTAQHTGGAGDDMGIVGSLEPRGKRNDAQGGGGAAGAVLPADRDPARRHRRAHG